MRIVATVHATVLAARRLWFVVVISVHGITIIIGFLIFIIAFGHRLRVCLSNLFRRRRRRRNHRRSLFNRCFISSFGGCWVETVEIFL